LEISFEYILAGLTILLVLASTQIFMYMMMMQRLTALEQESGYTVAEEILDMILLSPGYPPDWGRNLSEYPVSFGLAEYNAIRAYVLDPYKVARLLEDSTGYILPPEARALMGLRSSFHFSLRIRPIFNITVEDKGGGIFLFTVLNSKGYLAPNVNVTAYYVPTSIVPGTEYPKRSNITSIDGKCSLDFSGVTGQVLVVQAEEMEARVIVNYPSEYNFVIESGEVFESDTFLVTELEYSTGSVVGIGKESASRVVEIGGLTYIVEFDLWG